MIASKKGRRIRTNAEKEKKEKRPKKTKDKVTVKMEVLTVKKEKASVKEEPNSPGGSAAYAFDIPDDADSIYGRLDLFGMCSRATSIT